MVELEIDGKKISVPDGSTIIEAADQLGVYIPRFCYHKKLSIAANCRMCLVEVEKVGKPLPACATPVTPGMRVMTRSPKALEAQRAVMEFLLINHPLDCPICDQGGECELQDLSMGFGAATSEYTATKRAVFSEDIGPLIETEMTRCIHCTRCVRFGEEVAGLREMGATGRGESMQIGTYVQHFLQSELSGNIIDLCPVGALTNKPARYVGRSWEYREHPMVAPHDCVGAHLFVHTRGRQLVPERTVMRAVPRECDAINETWASDRDRYSVHGLYDASRVYQPRMKKNGQWVDVDWERALLEIADRTRCIVDTQGADQVAALASASATTEALYLLQKMIRALGSSNVDHRLTQQDFSDQAAFPAFPGFKTPIADIDTLDAVLLVGTNLRFEAPLVANRLQKAAVDGARVMAINAADHPFVFTLQEKITVSPAAFVDALGQVAKVLLDEQGESLDALSSVMPSEAARAMAYQLKNAKAPALFLGADAWRHPDAAQLRVLAQSIARLTGAAVNLLTPGANSAGAWLAGAVPHRGPAGAPVDNPGHTAAALLSTHPVRAYFLWDVEPENDTAYPAQALAALQQAGLVVCISRFASEAMADYADFILPLAAFTKTPGSFVNVQGTWQSFSAVSPPYHDAKPGWKILRVLATFLELEGFSYRTVHEVHDELKRQVEAMPKRDVPDHALVPVVCDAALMRYAPWPIYRVDALVRRSEPLQQVGLQAVPAIVVNTALSVRLGFRAGELIQATQGQTRVTLPLAIDDRLADNTVMIQSGLAETEGFGQAEAPITLERGHA
jgi:NADH-quinone oxidoreductase subunit G